MGADKTWHDKEEYLKQAKECKYCRELDADDTLYMANDWDGGIGFEYIRHIKYCPICGRKLFNWEE